jgi:septal ring factor EnvC (AmiA/AmiB activator)
MRRPIRIQTLTGVALSAMVLTVSPVSAAKDDTLGRQLEAVERKLQQDRDRVRALQEGAVKLAGEIEELRAEMISAAKKVQGHESEMSAKAQRLAALEARAEVKQARLAQRRGQLAGTLAALQRLALHPQEAVIAHPMPSNDTVRSVILLRTTVPRLEQRAARLQIELTQLAALRRDIVDQRARLATAGVALANERRRLAKLLSRKARLHEQTAAERAAVQNHMRVLGDEAKDLRDLLARLERDRVTPEPAVPIVPTAPTEPPATARRDTDVVRLTPPAPQPDATPDRTQTALLLPPVGAIQPFSTARGRLVLPARGQIIRRYGQKSGLGTRNKGLRIRTRSEAQVVAPYDGQIVFAGPFRGYGLMLIIKHSEGYHSLLAGLSRLDGVPGQWILAGEPVGVMGSPKDGGPVLYVELRHNGQPINPLPWLAAFKG